MHSQYPSWSSMLVRNNLRGDLCGFGITHRELYANLEYTTDSLKIYENVGNYKKM